ncbi:MAG: hypothetical protein ABIP17_13920 [Ilumatobacteraceae bacterium]
MSIVAVPAEYVNQTIAAALDCPGECIFLEDDEDDEDDDSVNADIIDAVLVDAVIIDRVVDS